jgi:hypothetical protein
MRVHNILCSNRTPGNDCCTYSFRAASELLVRQLSLYGTWDAYHSVYTRGRGTNVKQVWAVTRPEVVIFAYYARVEHVLQRTAGSSDSGRASPEREPCSEIRSGAES